MQPLLQGTLGNVATTIHFRGLYEKPLKERTCWSCSWKMHLPLWELAAKDVTSWSRRITPRFWRWRPQSRILAMLSFKSSSNADYFSCDSNTRLQLVRCPQVKAITWSTAAPLAQGADPIGEHLQKAQHSSSHAATLQPQGHSGWHFDLD